MASGLAMNSVTNAQPSIRPVKGNPDRTGLGARYSAMASPSAKSDDDAGLAPRTAKMGDASAAKEIASLARRYKDAALNAVRRGQK